MIHLITSVSRFTLIFMIAIYTYDSFKALKNSISEKKEKRLYHKQAVLIYAILFNADIVIFLNTMDWKVLLLMGGGLFFLMITMFVYKSIYHYASKALVSNMCMLLSISFIILTRLSIDKAEKQMFFASVALGLTALIPFIIHKCRFLSRLTWVYALGGILGLGLVAVAGSRVYGAKLNISIGGITVQPSEFIKIIFVFFIACMFKQAVDFRQILLTTAIALFHILILIASHDLGSAGIFFITYLVMLFVATQKPVVLFAGIVLIIVGLVLAYSLFAYVRVRFVAWQSPLSVANDQGYQICQSLFAIGTGGWFGSGLCLGMPNKIPVVAQDFVFSAISEEMGGFFALCLIFICISCFLLFLNVAMQIHDSFYKLTALGLGTVYGVQVFLTLGGVTKFIPSTGVTLPLVSYGGSSLLSTMILFAVIQGLYVIHVEETMQRNER